LAAHRILIVDDTPIFLELEALCLARSGQVLTATSGAAGLELARRERPHVVVVDLDMPGLGGDAVCAAIKADPELAATRVVIVTAGDSGADHARAVRAGADDVLTKPINRVSLLQSVQRFVRFAEVRGLTRVELEGPVRLERPGLEAWGTGRNLSRGGIFVESERGAAPRSELALQFHLPGASDPLRPTAQVMWQREASGQRPYGLGLRFLALDRAEAQRIDEFVYVRASTRADATAEAPVTVR
jgi:uncharacterized protein (TIGR02266 family)